MSIKQVTPYLSFNGTAEAAIALYTRALGAEVQGLLRYAEMPAEAGTCAPADKQRVMHACLRIGEAQLMLSDVPESQPVPTETNVNVCLELDDIDEMQRKFEALAAGGTVVMNIHDAFWGSKFGMLKDQFGVDWMFIGNASER
ncbi:MAG TPA: VOC family protein [Enhygromyxa sp.]|nr:VOC family protein [Enhygromyxa sp.]